MTSKKKLIEGYFEKNKSIKRAHNQETSKYSHNRVFDEPESLKKLTIDHKKNSNKRVTNGKQIDNKWITKGKQKGN